MFLSPKFIINKSSCLAYSYGITRYFIFFQIKNIINSQIYKAKFNPVFYNLFNYKARLYYFWWVGGWLPFGFGIFLINKK